MLPLVKTLIALVIGVLSGFGVYFILAAKAGKLVKQYFPPWPDKVTDLRGREFTLTSDAILQNLGQYGEGESIRKALRSDLRKVLDSPSRSGQIESHYGQKTATGMLWYPPVIHWYVYISSFEDRQLHIGCVAFDKETSLVLERWARTNS